ncbi:MAG TPA: CGNR zinc finger domain-containing protein [Acidimicrobiales bacterium]
MGLAPTNEPAVRLVIDFVNTLDVDEGTDALTSPEGLGAWLRERQLLGERERVGADDLALARRLRDGLRVELQTHHGTPPDAEARRALDEVAAQVPLRVTFDGGPELAAAAEGPRAGLGAVLTAVAGLARTGDWPRLKICPADDCAWAFYDESRNRSRRWCSMEVCGNRAKLRSYRERRAR